MILLLVGFRQTSSDITIRATATTKQHGGASTLPTVNFRTNPDLTTTADLRTTQFTAPKATFGSLDVTSSAESALKSGSLKAEIVGLDHRTNTNSEKNV